MQMRLINYKYQLFMRGGGGEGIHYTCRGTTDRAFFHHFTALAIIIMRELARILSRAFRHPEVVCQFRLA